MSNEINMTENFESEKAFLPSYGQKVWVNTRERILEWYRLYFHTGLVTIFLIWNSLISISSLLLFIQQFVKAESGPNTIAKFLPGYLQWIVKGVSHFYIPLNHSPFLWLFCIFFCYFVWCYSTITQPIVRGSRTVLSYTSERGRKFILITTIIQMSILYCGLFAWYIHAYMFDYFSNVRVDHKPFLKITSMEGFVNFIMTTPIFICLLAAFIIAREFYKNEDFRKRFFTWEFSFLLNQSFSLRNNKCDVVVGWEQKTDKPIVLSEPSRFLHEVVIGATGSGKTSTAILIRIVQDLVRIARGHKMGIIVLEPKSDLINDVQKLAAQLGIPKSKIKVVDPTDLVKSIRFNPLAGPLEVAAETWRGVLDALSGDQDPFFKGQQSETSAQYVMLGKIRYGNQFNFISHLQRMYTEPRYLADITEEVRNWINHNLENQAITSNERIILERYDRVCTYFENEVLDYVYSKDKEGGQLPVLYPIGHKYAGKQIVTNKKDKFITGAKKYVTDISMNALLSELLVVKEGEETLELDSFLNEGGVLLFNSALAELEELSLMFGQFIIRQLQSAVFRRPPEEQGGKRIPIFFTIDEFPLYINEAFARLLTLGRSYKVGTLIAIQNLGQLRVVQPGYEEVILSNASNKTVFGRGEVKDNEYFSKQFGEQYIMEESLNESVTPMSMPNQSRGLRYNTSRKLQPRFTPTQIKEQPFKHFIVEVVGSDGSIKEPVQAYGKFIDETKFLKRFIDIGNIELTTKNYNPLKGNIQQLSYLLRKLGDTNLSVAPAREVTTTLVQEPKQEGGESREQDVVEGHEQSTVSTSDDMQGQDSNVKSAEEKEENHVTQQGLDGGRNKVQRSASNGVGDKKEQPGAGHKGQNAADIDLHHEISPSTHSIPDDIDALIKSVHDNLLDSLNSSKDNKKQFTTRKKGRAANHETGTKPSNTVDINDLDDLTSSDRKKTNKQKQYANESIKKVEDWKEDIVE